MADETPENAETDATEPQGTAEVTVETAGIDIDGDGVVDAVVVRTTTAIDVDGDGVIDAVEVVEAVGVDANQDGRLTEDEITVSGAVYVRDDLLDENADDAAADKADPA